jgi:hypothetical protein
MESFIVNIRDVDLKEEIKAAFVSSFANSEALSPENLVVKHLENCIKQVLNDYRQKMAVEQALLNVVKEETLL